MNNVSLEDLKNFESILPPKEAQHAIVSKIEELLSELDKGKQQLETAQQQLKIYRQAVLKWAFEGKFTNENVKEGELPMGWSWVKSGELFSYVTSGSRGWAKYYSNSGAIFIRITNMDFDSLKLDLKESNIQYVNLPTNSEGIRTKIQEGDFLFSITGYLGMFAIAPKLENAYVNQHVCLCRPKEGFNKKYVGYWIISKSGGHHHLNQNQKGAVKAGLNLDDLKTFPVPLAPIEEQQLIVQEIESRLSVCDKVDETINQSLAQAETLRQSILKKAFEGRLV
jgi:type I restriction enzyme S subunit